MILTKHAPGNIVTKSAKNNYYYYYYYYYIIQIML